MRGALRREYSLRDASIASLAPMVAAAHLAEAAAQASGQ